MFQNIAPRRFVFSIILISSFIWITLFNLDEADKLFSEIQQQLSDGLGWLIILLANGFLVFGSSTSLPGGHQVDGVPPASSYYMFQTGGKPSTWFRRWHS